MGFKADADKEPEFKAAAQYALSLYAKTPEYNFDGVVAQVGASYSTAKAKPDFIGNKDVLDQNAFGASVKAGYVTDTISATVSSDLGYDIKAEKFGVDVAANVAYDFITVDGYYANEVVNNKDGKAVKNLLSTKVVADLASFDVSVKLTATLKDLINKQDMGLKAEFNATEELALSVNAGYVVKSKDVSTGVGATYTTDNFTVSGEVGYAVNAETKNTSVLTVSASVESSTLVPGATLKLAYGAADNDQNLLKDQTPAAQNFGKVVASINVAF